MDFNLVYVAEGSNEQSKGIVYCYQTCRILSALSIYRCEPKLVQYLLTQTIDRQ